MNENNQNDLNAIFDNMQSENQTTDNSSTQNVVSSSEQVQTVEQPNSINHQVEIPQQIESITTIDNNEQNILQSDSPQPFYNMENQPVVDMQNNQNQPIIKEKRKTPVILIISIIFIFVLCGLVVFDRFFLVKGDRIIKKEIKTTFLLMKEAIDEAEKNTLNYDLEKESLGFNGDITMTSDYENDELKLKKLKDYKISYDGVIDKKNNKLSGNISLLKNNSPLVEANGYIDGKTIILQSEQLLSKSLRITLDDELKEIDTTKSINYDSIKELVDRIEIVTLNSINKAEISKTTTKKVINGKDINILTVTYKFKLKELFKLYSEDEKIVNILSKLYGIKTDRIKEYVKIGV